MFSLTYLSSATRPLFGGELATLLERARDKNERLGISGMMLYSGGNFVQTLEGPRETVDALFSLIDADPRHHEVFIVRREEIEERLFAGWHMGYREISAEQTSDLPGFTDYLRTGRIEGDTPRRSAALTFHRVFRETMR